MNEEEIYELISQEIDNEKTKKSLWTKAFSESVGDEQKAKALYIKYRFDQLKDDQKQTDEEKNSNINEEFDTSENKHNCYYCTKPKANLRIIFKGEFRQFCNDECYQSCLTQNSLSEKTSKEQQEYWGKKSKRIKEESLENNDSEQPPKNIPGLKYYFYLKIIIGIDIFLIILSIVWDLKVDFLILNLGTWLVLFVTFYIYFFWKIEKYNLYIKLLISVVAFSSALFVNVVYYTVVIKPQEEIWYKETMDEVLRKYENTSKE